MTATVNMGALEIARKLHVADGVDLPLDAALARFVVLGKSGAGKSNANVVMAEELIRSGIPTWMLDPLGNLWGLRSSLDGERGGLPVVIFGGQHADAPLGQASQVCRVVAGEKISALLDLSELDLEDQRLFAEEFCTELLAIAKATGLIGHLFLDEADRFAPNTLGVKKVAAVKRFARVARNFSIGWTFSSQRVQLLNPEVIESANVLIAMKMPSGLAQEKLGIKLLGAFDNKAEMRSMTETLPRLQKGEAWFVPDADWMHGEEDARPQRFRFRWRETFDSTQVQRIGMETRQPRAWTDIDLDAIRGAMDVLDVADAVAVDAELENRLRGQIADLQRQLEQRVVTQVPYPVFTDADTARIEAATLEWKRTCDEFAAFMAPKFAELGRIAEEFWQRIEAAMATAKAGKAEPAPQARKVVSHGVDITNLKIDRYQQNGKTEALRPPARRMLAALALRHPNPLSRRDLGALIGVRQTSGSFSSYVSELTTRELIEAPRGGDVAITAAGLDEIADEVGGAPKSVDEIIAVWRTGKKPLRPPALKMLDVLLECRHATRAQISERIGVATTSGSFSSYISELRSRGLIEVSGGHIHLGATLRAALEA
jgi:uncharacterized protein